MSAAKNESFETVLKLKTLDQVSEEQWQSTADSSTVCTIRTEATTILLQSILMFQGGDVPEGVAAKD